MGAWLFKPYWSSSSLPDSPSVLHHKIEEAELGRTVQEAEVLVEQGDLLQQVSVASMAGGMVLMGIPISILFTVLFRINAESECIANTDSICNDSFSDP